MEICVCREPHRGKCKGLTDRVPWHKVERLEDGTFERRSEPFPHRCDYCHRGVQHEVLSEDSTHMCVKLAIVLTLYSLYRRYSDCWFLGPDAGGVLTYDTVELLDAMVRHEHRVHGRPCF